MGASASVKKEESDESDDDDDEESLPNEEAPSTSDIPASDGGALSLLKSVTVKKKHNTFFTAEELNEIKEIENMQKKATAFISDHFYYGVPVKIVRQSVDPYSPVFVQPETNLAFERVHIHQLSAAHSDWEVVKSVPSFVMVNNKGKIVISFDKSGISYTFSINNLLENIANSRHKIVDPDPPILLSRTTSSLTLGWENLPDPPGLTQYVEVQYARLLRHKNKAFFNYLDTTVKVDGTYDCDEEETVIEPWSALVSKTWDMSNFTQFSFGELSSGASYVFRLRYRNHRGWSEFSKSSAIYRTVPGPPMPPVSPLSDAIMPHAVHLRWSPPKENNGATVTSYILEGRAVGDTFRIIFSGMRLSYVVFNLFPQASYNFQVSAVNSVGKSEPSTIYSILTPSILNAPPYTVDWRGGTDFMSDYLQGIDANASSNDLSQTCYANAQRCRDAWATHYDLITDRMFFFNVLTGSRQLNIPNALRNSTGEDAAEESMGAEIRDEVEIANEKKKEFRLKRFRFIRDVHVNRRQKYKEIVARLQRIGATKGHTVADKETAALSSPFTLPVMRCTLLADAYTTFAIPGDAKTAPSTKKMKPVYDEQKCNLLGKLLKKLRVVFHEEAGIDVGGLSKEYFLLLSEQMVAYMSKTCRNMITYTESGRLFFNEDFCEEIEVPRPAMRNETSATASSSSRNKLSPYSLTKLLDIGVSGMDFAQFFGRMIGKAIYDQQMLHMPLSEILLSHLIGFTGNVTDSRGSNDTNGKKSRVNNGEILFSDEALLDLDSVLFKSLKWIEKNNIEGIIDNTFTVISKANKTKTEKEINLCKNGDQIEVNDKNKLEYIKLIMQWKTSFSVSSLLSNFLDGFWEIVPLEVMQKNGITAAELELIMNGKPAIDVEEIRAYTVFQGEPTFSDNHPQVIQLWQIIREFEEENKRLFLLFVTGTSRVPLDGFEPAFNITQGTGMENNSLPRAHTCFNQLVLPFFTSLDIMRERILFAIKETEGFQLS